MRCKKHRKVVKQLRQAAKLLAKIATCRAEREIAAHVAARANGFDSLGV